MRNVLTRLTTPSLTCLTLMLAAGCGDSLANGQSVDLETAFALSHEEAVALTTQVWKRQSDLRYTSFLEVAQDRGGGFLCHNDGKSVSGAFSFLEVDGEIVMTGPAGHGEGAMIVENVRFEGDNLIISGSEKGVAYAQTYTPIAELPDICKRLKAGEEPSFDDYLASWDPEK